MREMEQGHPSMRIYLFGEFIVERLLSSPASSPSAPQYERVKHEEWHSRGPAVALLKALLCRPRRRASRDALIELLWPPDENGESEHAFDSAVSILRNVLRTQQGESLLTKARIGGITIYALPNQQRLWVDADAFEQSIDQAMNAERRGEDALPWWEAAHALMAGEFLEDDPYSGWAQTRRHVLNAARHRCVHRLVDLYLTRNMADQAETLLQEAVMADPTDEDMLCRLMVLLECQGRYQEAWHLYQQSVRILDEEYHTQPLPRTRALAERICNEPVTATIKQVSPAMNRLSLPSPVAAPREQARSFEIFFEASKSIPEQQESAWLTLGVSSLGQLLDAGWSRETLLETLTLLLTGIQAMPALSRRTFLQVGATALMSRIPIPTGTHVSAEEQTRLAYAFGKSIAASWKLFHTAGNAQVLAVGYAQLSLLEHAGSSLSPALQPLFYSGVYRLIGAALHFQGDYPEAFQAHEKAYIAALERADGWNMAQSRSWQAYGWQALGHYEDALQATDAALRLIADCSDSEHLRLRARLLAFGAENASLRGDVNDVQRRLDSSEALLEYLPTLHEEFDRLSWLQASGICALNLGHPTLAIQRLQPAIDELPVQWARRYISTALPLARAFASLKEQEATLAVAQQMVPVLKALQAKTLSRAFEHYLREDVLANFPHDAHCQAFYAEARQQLALVSSTEKERGSH